MVDYAACCAPGRFKVRDRNNKEWYDACDYEMYVRNETNTGWLRIFPGKALVRHGTNDCWIEIECDDTEEDPCAVEYAEAGLLPDGSVPAGTEYDPETGTYVPITDSNGDPIDYDPGTISSGYAADLYVPGDPADPNAGTIYRGTYSTGTGNDRVWVDLSGDSDLSSGSDNTGFGTTVGGELCIYQVDDPASCKTYSEGGTSNTPGGGGMEFAIPCGSMVESNGAEVTEVWFDLQRAHYIGNIPMNFVVLSGSVYFEFVRGTVFHSTDGYVTGSGHLDHNYTADEQNDGLGAAIMARMVANPPSSEWRIQVECTYPNGIPVDDSQFIGPDGEIDYSIPPSDPADEPYGTVLEPAPCGAVMDPDQFGGQGMIEVIHDLGEDSGLVTLDYQTWYQPDRIDVFSGGRMLATTGGFVAERGALYFDYTPDMGLVTIRVTARDPGTSWGYRVSCPGEGGIDNPPPCGTDFESSGAGVTDVYIDAGLTPGIMVIRYNAWNVEDSIDVFQGNALVASTDGYVVGIDALSFAYDPANGTTITIRVVGDPGTSTWGLKVQCPVDSFPVLSITDFDIGVEFDETEGTHNASIEVCLDSPAIAAVTFEYYTQDGTANSVAAQGTILAYDTSNNPYIAVADDVGSAGEQRRLVMDGGFPKYYNSTFSGTSFATLPASFQFLYNCVQWLANPSKVSVGNKRVLLIGDVDSGGNYNVKDTTSSSFGTSIVQTIVIAGYNPVVLSPSDIGGVPMNAPFADLDTFCACIFMSSNTTGNKVSDSLVASFTRFVQEGNGMMFITDHDVFQPSANAILANFGANFYGNVNRTPISVSALTAAYGNHALWANVTGDLGGGGSEGNIAVTTSVADYEPTFGTGTIPPGQLCTTVTVPIIGDPTEEADETFTFHIANASNVDTEDETGYEAEITIVNDDYPIVPCGGSSLTGSSSTKVGVEMGSEGGLIEVTYATVSGTGTAANEIIITVDNIEVASTGGPVVVHDTTPEVLRFVYDPAIHGSVAVLENIGDTFWFYSFACPIPPLSIEALVFDTTAEIEQVKGSYVPPSAQDIFNTWPRTDGEDYYANGSVAAGEADDWVLSNGSILMPSNTAAPNTFISPEAFDSYTHEATLTSAGADDDGIGIVLAFSNSSGDNKVLALVRTGGGVAPANGFGVVLHTNSSGDVIHNVDVGGIRGNWNGSYSRVKAVRVGDSITVSCSGWNSETVLISTEFTIDLTSDPKYSEFLGSSPYGYYTYSQGGSTYYNITFYGGDVLDKLFDYESGDVWEYIAGAWQLVGNGNWGDHVGHFVNITNPMTEIDWSIKVTSVAERYMIDVTPSMIAGTGPISSKIGLLHAVGTHINQVNVSEKVFVASAGSYTLDILTDDSGEVWINSELVGTTASLTQASFPITLVSGKNVVRVRNVNEGGGPHVFELRIPGVLETADISGWVYKSYVGPNPP